LRPAAHKAGPAGFQPVLPPQRSPCARCAHGSPIPASSIARMSARRPSRGRCRLGHPPHRDWPAGSRVASRL